MYIMESKVCEVTLVFQNNSPIKEAEQSKKANKVIALLLLTLPLWPSAKRLKNQAFN